MEVQTARRPPVSGFSGVTGVARFELRIVQRVLERLICLCQILFRAAVCNDFFRLCNCIADCVCTLVSVLAQIFLLRRVHKTGKRIAFTGFLQRFTSGIQYSSSSVNLFLCCIRISKNFLCFIKRCEERFEAVRRKTSLQPLLPARRLRTER